jgi:hypothetical protein
MFEIGTIDTSDVGNIRNSRDKSSEEIVVLVLVDTRGLEPVLYG